MESNTWEYLKEVVGKMPVGVFIDICKGIEAHQVAVSHMRIGIAEQAVARLDKVQEEMNFACDMVREAGEELKKTQNAILCLEVDHPTPDDLAKPLSEAAGIDVDDAVKRVGFVLGLAVQE